MALQIDATVRYAVDKWTGDLTQADLHSRFSPVQHLRQQGPSSDAHMSSPGEAALKAALEPLEGDWLFYVLQDTQGNHFFTSSYDEFLRAKENQPSQ